MAHTYIVDWLDPEDRVRSDEVNDIDLVTHSDIAPGYIDLFDAGGRLDCSFRDVIRIYRKPDQDDDATVRVTIDSRDFAGVIQRAGADKRGR